MKKCASCTKDLPDAALHCVFCGAKQAPAPAVAGSVAKTVMGHASNEMIEQLKAQAAAAASRNQPAPAPAPSPFAPPAQAPSPFAPPAQAPMPAPQRPGYAGPGPNPNPAPPSAGSVAPTMFVPGGGPPMGGPAPMAASPGHPGNAPTMMAGPGGLPPAPGGGPLGMPPGPGMGMGPGMPPGSLGMPPGPGMMPPAPAPMPGMGPGAPGPAPAPIPSATPPYLASRTAARAGRPIEPWKDALRLMMFIWGGALLVAFMVPVGTKPDLRFMFQMIIDGEGTAKLGPLLMAAIGLLSIVLAAIPMSPSPRGLIGGLLGVAGIVVPQLLFLSKGDFGLGQILAILNTLGILMMVPGLFLRSEYQDSIMPRIMVTLGALCVLAGYLIPQGDGLPLIDAFKLLIDAPGKGKIAAIFLLGPALLSLVSLLVWLPAPGGAGAKVYAYLWIFWGAIVLLTALLVQGHIGDVVGGSPYVLVGWVAGVSEGGVSLVGSAYLVLVGYGLATVLGKKLE